MKHFYSIFYNPTIYGHEPYIKDNKIYIFDVENDAKKEVEIVKSELKQSLKPIKESRGWFKTPVIKYVNQTEHGKIIKRVLDTIHVRKVTLHHEKNY